MGGEGMALRRDLTYRVARRLAQLGDFDVTYPRFAYRDELRALSADWRRETGSSDALTQAHWHLYSLARSVANLPGDTVECGVHTGRGSWAICRGNPAHKLHHCFDSWEGLSEPVTADGAGWQAGDLSTPMERAQHNLSQFPQARFYPGWIPARFGDLLAYDQGQPRYSLVHIDVDLYQPTLDCLTFFYERVIPGGVIVCDDYGATVSPGSKAACDEFFADRPEGIVHLVTGQAVVWKR